MTEELSPEERELQEIRRARRSFFEKLSLLAIGTFVTLVTFLLSQFLSSYVTYAVYNEDKVIWSTILVKISNVEDDIKEIKTDMKEKKKTGK